MKKLLLLSTIIFLFSACQRTNIQEVKLLPIDASKTLTTIAFGSCNKEYEPQPLWSQIIKHQPNLWIWTGDNIYGDTEDMNEMKQKYELQNANKEYQSLLEIAPIIGIWDDHDYGANDGDKDYSKKKESRDLMFDFLGVSTDNVARNREGAYQSYSFGENGQQVKIILLDARYFRDELAKDTVSEQRYIPNATGDVLGETQWNWLNTELGDTSTDLFIIACGIQFIAKDHYFEKWANFPMARNRLFKLLEDQQPKAALLLSGDRHIAEISKIKLDGLPYDLFDITSSGLTHSYEKVNNEINEYRVDDKLSGQKNFGILRIDWSKQPLKVKAEVRGENNNIIFDQEIVF